MNYSLNIKGNDFVKGAGTGINASMKDLAIVCTNIRYMSVENAFLVLDSLIMLNRAIPFNRYNKRQGSRSELSGKKGAYPIKAAKEVRKVLENAVANAVAKGKDDAEKLFVVHAAANKTLIIRRNPSRGTLAYGRGMYGRSAIAHSDIELAKVEIALGEKENEKLTSNMKYFINKKNKDYENTKKQIMQKVSNVPAKPEKEKKEKAGKEKEKSEKKKVLA